MNRRIYSSDLTDQEWALLLELVPPAKAGGRPRITQMREVLNVIFYNLPGGCAWRVLPHDFTNWKTVYHYWREWSITGLWERINIVLRQAVRKKTGRESEPSVAVIDSQSVKTTERGGTHGSDDSKKISGRKRHLLVDTLGLLLKVKVHVLKVFFDKWHLPAGGDIPLELEKALE